ncbi:hypothetical protein K1T71_014012 [Dendrolimus kikuchii]|uniref:Uncharacterized protein n=1 Tax=Dendrolimus kikuchii TaxID=765133 RepID=A0ACC1CGD5_9NEOP|nr:hypothetical protein K1T71_014012 [Dendrolimus kikuchii]
MADLKTLILNLIYKTEDNFCYLCLKNYNQDMLINFVDDIVLSDAKSLSIIDLVACVLGEEFKQTICLSDWICSNCTRALVSCYNFIEACQENLKKTHMIVKNINKFLEKSNNVTQQPDCNPTYFNIDTEGSIVDYNLSNTYCQVVQTFNNSSEDISKYDINQDSVQGVEASIKNIKNCKPVKANDLRCQDDKSRFKCKICLQTYARGQNLMKHYYRAHAPKKYKCNICQKKYGTLLMLKDHVNTSHSKAVCSHCGKVYNNKLSVKNHEKSHIERHICPHCELKNNMEKEDRNITNVQENINQEIEEIDDTESNDSDVYRTRSGR